MARSLPTLVPASDAGPDARVWLGGSSSDCNDQIEVPLHILGLSCRFTTSKQRESAACPRPEPTCAAVADLLACEEDITGRKGPRME